MNLKYDGGKKNILLEQEDILIKCRMNYQNKDENLIVSGDFNCVYFLDCKVTEELKQIYLAREIINRIQKTRKSAGVKIEDQIVLIINFKDKKCPLYEIYQK